MLIGRFRSHSGVCHSDLCIMTSSWNGLPFPTLAGQVGGHEGAGKIVKLGPGSVGVKVGDRVGIKWMADICGTCRKSLPRYRGVIISGRKRQRKSARILSFLPSY